MTQSRFDKLLALTEKFQKMAEDLATVNPNEAVSTMTPALSPADVELRKRYNQLHDNITKKLRALLTEMGGDIYTLKQRGFDLRTLQIFIDLHQELVDHFHRMTSQELYFAAWEFVDYVLSRSVAINIDNLKFLIEHHMAQTKVPGKLPPFAGQAQVNSLQKIQDYAVNLKHFLENNQTIKDYIPEKSGVHPIPESAPQFSTEEGTKILE